MREQFTFADFTFPRGVAMLPEGRPAERLAKHKDWSRKVAGHYGNAPAYNITTYETAPRPRPNTDGAFFYLESDFMPGLRWCWCDEVRGVSRSIQHRGWYCDEFQDQTIRGLVMRLPQGRGLLIGYSMGEGMASHVDTDSIYEVDDEVGAALAADNLAERAAERERQASEEESARSREEETQEESRERESAAVQNIATREA